MNAVKETPSKEEDNYYQILEVKSTATLTEIRNAYEEKLEEAHLEAIAAYSLFPEEETEEKLLNYSQAFVALANPIARSKYDDEIQQNPISNQKQLQHVQKKNKKNDKEKFISSKKITDNPQNVLTLDKKTNEKCF